MIRDRFALALVSITVALLPLLGTVAVVWSTRRSVDVVVLWLAGALQLGLVLTWVFIPRLPKWIVGGWGLILFATGIGVTIAAPVAATPADGSTFPWALFGLVIVGILTMIAAVIHTSPRSPASDARRYPRGHKEEDPAVTFRRSLILPVVGLLLAACAAPAASPRPLRVSPSLRPQPGRPRPQLRQQPLRRP